MTRDVGKRLHAAATLLLNGRNVNRATLVSRLVSGAGLAHMKAKAKRIGPSANEHGQGKARRWSARVTKTSNALDLEPGVFTQRSPRAIAASLKRSALASRRRKAEPFQSAMSMLNFHINRSGHSLGAHRRRVLERAKVELRRLFGRVP